MILDMKSIWENYTFNEQKWERGMTNDRSENFRAFPNRVFANFISQVLRGLYKLQTWHQIIKPWSEINFNINRKMDETITKRCYFEDFGLAWSK